MVAFKKMWDDINSKIDHNCTTEFQIKKRFETGFIIEEDGKNIFLTRDDFVNFWCWFLYNEQIKIEDIVNNKNPRFKYVLNLVKGLPYTKVEREKLILVS